MDWQKPSSKNKKKTKKKKKKDTNSKIKNTKKFRKDALAKKKKKKIFNYSREKYPNAKIFGLTTGLAVMKINSSLGYKPVTYSELTQDNVFWSGCQSCVNFEILQSKERKNCLCTAMLYQQNESKKIESENNAKLFSKFKKIKAILWKK